LTILEVAKTGLFSQSGLTAFRSAEKANLYEVMQYLSFQADVDKLNKLAEQSQAQKKKK
jgi:hypothetical protein